MERPNAPSEARRHEAARNEGISSSSAIVHIAGAVVQSVPLRRPSPDPTWTRNLAIANRSRLRTEKWQQYFFQEGSYGGGIIWDTVVDGRCHRHKFHAGGILHLGITSATLFVTAAATAMRSRRHKISKFIYHTCIQRPRIEGDPVGISQSRLKNWNDEESMCWLLSRFDTIPEHVRQTDIITISISRVSTDAR